MIKDISDNGPLVDINILWEIEKAGGDPDWQWMREILELEFMKILVNGEDKKMFSPKHGLSHLSMDQLEMLLNQWEHGIIEFV